jgi:cytochrome bd-type quinol oxidase subunit 1
LRRLRFALDRFDAPAIASPVAIALPCVVDLGAIASCLMMYPLGDAQARNVAAYQPVTLSAMERLFHTEKGAALAILGQPDMQSQTLQTTLVVPDVLSFLTYRRWHAQVKGLDAYPQDQWPDNVPLLYYAYHNMVGLGSFLIAILVFALFALWRGWLIVFKSESLMMASRRRRSVTYLVSRGYEGSRSRGATAGCVKHSATPLDKDFHA